ncbi:MAG: MbcA/ParS/Xre antitoxin family protein [Chloroflexota bacterium]|nr:MbcA/ParS/Xre antitoxin family protein [Chloroflexota bacterium]
MAMLDMGSRQAIEQIECTLNLSDRELAHQLSATPRTLNRWRMNETYPQHVARERLATLVALADHLHETFQTSDAISLWLDSANRYLGNFTPADALRAGRFDRVEAALGAFDAGVFL